MFFFIGVVVVIGSILGGYLPHGTIDVLLQPLEFLIIGGAALGGFIIANPKPILLGTAKDITRVFKGPPHDRDAPSSASTSLSGAGGLLSGRSLDSWGVRVSEKSRESVVLELAPPPEAEEETAETEAETETEATEETEVGSQESDQTADENIDETTLETKLAELEQRRFGEAVAELRQAIQELPDLAQLAQHLIIDMTPEGLRIQIVDQAAESMFPLGSTQMYDHTRLLMRQIARVIERLPNRIAITGHTDARPYPADNVYSNWELSADRANASRRELVTAGIAPDRVAHVTGKAAREPLFAEDPTLPNNRRISIVLLRDAPVMPPQGQ